jgi:hypothetical protein
MPSRFPTLVAKNPYISNHRKQVSVSDDKRPDGADDVEPEHRPPPPPPAPPPPPPPAPAEPDAAEAPASDEPLIEADRGLPPDAYLAGDPDEEY